MPKNLQADFAESMMPHLEALATKMLNNRDYQYLRIVADLMTGLSGGGWSRLADEDKARYLDQMKIDFHAKGMGDSHYGFDSDVLCRNRVDRRGVPGR